MATDLSIMLSAYQSFRKLTMIHLILFLLSQVYLGEIMVRILIFGKNNTVVLRYFVHGQGTGQPPAGSYEWLLK